MTRPAVTSSASTPDVHAEAGLPGLRTFRSPTFRTLMAFVLFVIGALLIGMLLLNQAADEDGQFAIDFADFHTAAERMAAGDSPYAAEMLAGPIDAQGQDRYRYPPLFAQLLWPLSSASLGLAAMVWFVLQAIAVAAALWVGTGIGGARRSLERALWCGVAALFFLPVFDTLWKGNVSGVLALSSVLVALGGAAAGVGAAAGALLKAVPGTLVPAALVMDRRARIAVIVTVATGLAVSFLLAPSAWLDYPTVVSNMLAGSSDYVTNVAPAAVVGRELGAGSDLVRLVALGIAAVSVVASAWMARTPVGLPAAALLGAIALLLVPSSLWYHYLVVLLPFAAIAWPRSSSLQRSLLFFSAALITVAIAWLPLALIGGIAMTSLSLYVLWPRAAGQTLGPAGRTPSDAPIAA